MNKKATSTAVDRPRKVKTDNTHLNIKVTMRAENLPAGNPLRILDCFCGDGEIWKGVQKTVTDRELKILSIDVKNKTNQIHLIGDNRKFLSSMDLTQFDVIDVDAYGMPYDQLHMIFQRPHKPGLVIFGTWMRTVIGRIPYQLLMRLGFSRRMIRKAEPLINRNGIEKFMGWLSLNGVTFVKTWSFRQYEKNYFYFSLP